MTNGRLMQHPCVNPKFHDLIPSLTPEELAGLEAAILRDGCRDALVVWNGTLIDGHNRLDICKKHGLPYEILEWEFKDEDEAMDWIDENQLARRNLSPDQASYIRGRRYNRTKRTKAQAGAIGGKSQANAKLSLASTAETIAKQHGVSARTIIRDGKRAEALDKLAQTNPEDAKDVRDGRKRFNEVRREIKRAELRKCAELPSSKFRILYADPPWSYNDKCDSGAIQAGGCEKEYPSMTIPELCAMPVASLCENDAVLFLWVTSPMLEVAFDVIQAWGFSYKASFVWDKVKHNMGHYNSVRHELLLVCTRGSCLPDNPKLFDSVQSIKKTNIHSQKPSEFRRIIETLYPYGKRLELFAREKPKGWEVHGNES